jgi:hypothetical protein
MNPSWLLFMSVSRGVWARLQGLIDFISSHSLNKAIQAKMWLFDSKLYETFPIVKVDGTRCDAHEMSTFNITQAYIWTKGQQASRGVLSKFKLRFIFIDLTSTPWSPLNMPCLSHARQGGPTHQKGLDGSPNCSANNAEQAETTWWSRKPSRLG